MGTTDIIINGFYEGMQTVEYECSNDGNSRIIILVIYITTNPNISNIHVQPLLKITD